MAKQRSGQTTCFPAVREAARILDLRRGLCCEAAGECVCDDHSCSRLWPAVWAAVVAPIVSAQAPPLVDLMLQQVRVAQRVFSCSSFRSCFFSC